MMTDAQLKALLRAKVREYGSQLAFAEAVGLSAQYVSDVLKGRRPAGPKLLKALGYEWVREIRPVA